MTLVLRSLPAKTIPRTLPATLNTANDHIKAIFAKAGAGSRGDLMATVFRDHSMPGLQQATRQGHRTQRSPRTITDPPSDLTPMTLQRKGDRMAGSERHQQDSSGHQPEYRSNPRRAVIN